MEEPKVIDVFGISETKATEIIAKQEAERKQKIQRDRKTAEQKGALPQGQIKQQPSK